ncbi:MAG: ABC transporter ATP-binding protein [Kiloniellales bacterium]|nr:ABC transporter ATP-binding protein [Kiloniellales bacterium]
MARSAPGPTGNSAKPSVPQRDRRLAQAAAGADRRHWLFGFVRPQLRRLALVFLLSLGASGLALAQPYLTKLLIDDGLLAGDYGTLVLVAAAMLAAALLGAGLTALNRWHYVTASGRVLFALRESVYRHLQRLSPAFYARVRAGDVMARLDGDVAEVQRFAVDSALALLNGVLVLCGALALMLSLSWELSLIAFALLPLQVLLLRVLRPRIEAMTREQRAQAGGISAFLYDRLSAMKLVQSAGAEAREARGLAGLQAAYFTGLRRLQMFNLAATTAPSLLTLLGTVLVFLAGGAMVIEGTLTLGTLVAFTAYLARATGPVQTLLGLWVALARARVSLERVCEITAEEPAVSSPEDPQPLPPEARGEVVLEAVTFGYPDREEPVLEDAAARLPAGAKIAIFGASGAGKTTLIDLLQRHFDPAEGRIALDSVDLRRLDLEDLRRRVAVVAQDSLLLPGSIADNIRYARPDAEDAAVAEAARRAGAAEFIAALPQGFETEVGARGLKLSGGQRQRIALARALLQDPLVLILDEATSGVDSAAEREIGAAIDRLFAGRTRIVIGHRSTLAEDAEVTFELAGRRLRVRDPETGLAAQ